MEPRILLLQARLPDDPSRTEELRSFARVSGLPAERFVPHDLLTGPPTIASLDDFDALMIGGSGDFYVSRGDLPHFAELLAFLRRLVDRGFPTFASCFGFQCLVEALGGEIIYDPERTEVGTFPLSLEPAGREDPLFKLLPQRFHAQVGHKDRAVRYPSGMINLASSNDCPHHALRIPGKPIWGTQFHPELDCNDNRGRFLRYLDGYSSALTEQQQEETLSRFVDSPETLELLPRFLQLLPS